MKNIDLRSVIIGILGAAVIFMLFGMRMQDQNFGKITAKEIIVEDGGSIRLLNKKGDRAIMMGSAGESGHLFVFDGAEGGISIMGFGAYLAINDSKGNTMASLSSIAGSGVLNIYDSRAKDGNARIKISSLLGTGYMRVFGKEGSEIIDIGPFGGLKGSAGGQITILNQHEKNVVVMQANKDADGMIALYDRYGDLGWAATGKK